MLGLRERDLPTDIAGFWRRWDEIVAKLENNPVVQDVLHNGPKRPFWLPLTQRRFDALNRPTMRLQRDVTTWTLDDDLREKFGLPALTRAEVRRLNRLAWVTRLLGRVLPDPCASRCPSTSPADARWPARPSRSSALPDAPHPQENHDCREARRRARDHRVGEARLGHRRGAGPAHRTGLPRRRQRVRAAAPRRAVRRSGDRDHPDQHRRRRHPCRGRGTCRRAPPGARVRTPTAPP